MRDFLFSYFWKAEWIPLPWKAVEWGTWGYTVFLYSETRLGKEIIPKLRGRYINSRWWGTWLKHLFMPTNQMWSLRLFFSHLGMSNSLQPCGLWQEYWSGLPFSLGDLPDPEAEPMSPALTSGFFTAEPPGKPQNVVIKMLLLMPTYADSWGDYIPHHLETIFSYSCHLALNFLSPSSRSPWLSLI